MLSFRALLVFLVVLVISGLGGCGGGSDATSSQTIQSIQISPPLASTAAGFNQQFSAVAQYADGHTEDVTSAVSWRSSNPTVVMIYSSGIANSLSAGSSQVTATMDGVTSNAATLTVTAANLVSIQVTPPRWTSAVGLRQQYTAIGTFSDHSTQDITDSVTWSSSDAGKVSIDGAGQASAIAAGALSITASLGSISSNVASATITSATLSALQVTPASSSQAVGLNQQYTAIGLYSDGTTSDVTSSVSWSADASGNASISSVGLATAGAPGAAEITAVLGGIVSNRAVMNITPAVLSSIQVQPENASKAAGLTQQYTAIGAYTDGTTRDITSSVSWLSSDPSKVTIGAAGVATGAGVGSSTVTAVFNGVISSPASFTVLPVALVSIQVAPASASKAVGLTQQYTAIGTYTAGPAQDITNAVSWTSSDTSKVTITAGGLATAVVQGSSVITATSGSISSNATILTVTPAVVVSITVTPGSASLAVGDTQNFVATGTYTDASTHDVSNSASWRTDDASKVTVSATGMATGVATGVANVSAQLNGVVSNSATVTVANRSWTVTAPMGSAHFRGLGHLLANGKVLIAGGNNLSGIDSNTELFDPIAGTWTTAGSMTVNRYYAASITLPDGRILAAGGGSGFTTTTSTEIFDPATGLWSAAASMPYGAFDARAVLLPGGKVLVAGGTDGNGMPVATAAVFDSATGLWSATGSMIDARSGHSMVVLASGKVLAAGGGNSAANLASAEIYDPATGQWTSTASMSIDRRDAVAVVLANGSVLVAGGSRPPFTYLASSEIYDPATGTWTSTGTMVTPRTIGVAVRLPSGKVLVTGGSSTTSLSAAAEIFDPATGTWTAAASMNYRRYNHLMTVLSSGKVLVCGGNGALVGGSSGNGNLSSCEVF